MIFDLLLRVGPAIQAIFELGYEPKEELFYELTPEEYNQLGRDGTDISKTWYTILPEDPKYNVSEVLIIDSDQKNALMDGAKYINNLCDDAEKPFSTFEEKLIYAASVLPPVFSKSSKIHDKNNAPHLKLVK